MDILEQFKQNIKDQIEKAKKLAPYTVTITLDKATDVIETHMGNELKDDEIMSMMLETYVNTAKDIGLSHKCVGHNCKFQEKTRRILASIDRILNSYDENDNYKPTAPPTPEK